jgi:hypothetical protein
MRKETLIYIREELITYLSNLDKEEKNIDEVEKTILMLNLYNFLDPERYNENIKNLTLKMR